MCRPDGRHANVRVAVRGTEREQRESLAALEHARAYLRHELAMRLSLRHVPELHFDQDRNPDVESRIDFLLKRAKKSRGPYAKISPKFKQIVLVLFLLGAAVGLAPALDEPGLLRLERAPTPWVRPIRWSCMGTTGSQMEDGGGCRVR